MTEPGHVDFRPVPMALLRQLDTYVPEASAMTRADRKRIVDYVDDQGKQHRVSVFSRVQSGKRNAH